MSATEGSSSGHGGDTRITGSADDLPARAFGWSDMFISPEDRSVPPSNLSLLGLVRHMADVERHWFREVMAGHDAPSHYPGDPDHNDFDGAVADPEAVRQAWDNWRAEKIAGRSSCARCSCT